MPSVPILKTAGLYTSVNELSSAPEGALSQADNVVIRSPNIIEPRRGVQMYSAHASGAFSLNQYGAAHLIIGVDSTETLRDYSTPKNYTGTFQAPDEDTNRISLRSIEAQRNFYIATRAGVKVIDSATMTVPYSAGVIEASTPAVSLAAGTWMSTASAVAYRVVWGRKDASGQLHLGKPSGRAVLVNASGGARQASITLSIPSEVTTSYFYRIYRSEMSASATSEPDDELFLVYENVPTSSQIAAGSVTVSDITPEILLSDPLYTNPSQGGILQGNDRPPWCWDLTEWSGRVWYSNTKLPQRLEWQMLSPPANNDVFTIFQQSYVVEQPAASGADDAFVLETYATIGLTTSAQQIAYAAQKLVHTINLRNKLGSGNQNYGNIRASYVSSPEDPPGKILIEATSFSVAAGYLGVSFTPTNAQPISDQSVTVTVGSTARTLGTTVTVTTGSAHGLSVGDSVVLTSTALSGTTHFYNGHDANFAPGIKTVASTPSGTTFTYAESGANATMTGSYRVHRASLAPSSNDRAYNRVYYSKSQEPEAVPLLNYIDVGVKNKDILRVVPLRDRLYVFKPEGIFAVSGEYPFRVDLVDNTVRTLSADSVATVSNSIYAFTDQGVVAVNDAGVRVVSKPIERALTQYVVSDDDNQVKSAFGTGYDPEGLYFLSPADELATYVYSVNANAWSKWTNTPGVPAVTFRSDGTGGAETTKLLCTSAYGVMAYAPVDNNPLASAVYYDYGSATANVLDQDSGSITLDDISDVELGDVIVSGTFRGVVTSINADVGGYLSCVTNNGVAGATATVYKGIECVVKWAALHGGEPHLEKHFQAVTYHFRRFDFYEPLATFETDKQAEEGTRAFYFADRDLTIDETIPWETRTVPRNKRVVIDQDWRRCSYFVPGFYIRQGYAVWALNGITVDYEPMSERNSR